MKGAPLAFDNFCFQLDGARKTVNALLRSEARALAQSALRVWQKPERERGANGPSAAEMSRNDSLKILAPTPALAAVSKHLVHTHAAET